MRDALVVLHPSVGLKQRCLWRIPRGGPLSYVSLPLRSPRLSWFRTGDLIHAVISGRCPIETDANVTVGLIAREKVMIWTRLVSLVTMVLCVGHSLLNTWGLFNWDSNRTATLAADETRLHTPVQKQGLPDLQITEFMICATVQDNFVVWDWESWGVVL